MPIAADQTPNLLSTLLAARRAKGWSQAELGRVLRLPQAQISRIERGLSDPRLATLRNLAGALDLDLMLVPRALGPAIAALIRDYPWDGATPAEPPPDERPLYRLPDHPGDADATRTDLVD